MIFQPPCKQHKITCGSGMTGGHKSDKRINVEIIEVLGKPVQPVPTLRTKYDHEWGEDPPNMSLDARVSIQ